MGPFFESFEAALLFEPEAVEPEADGAAELADEDEAADLSPELVLVRGIESEAIECSASYGTDVDLGIDMLG